MRKFIKKIIYPQIPKIGKRIEKRQFNAVPVIIGACPRSGTTLLQSILSAYPTIYAISNQTYAFTEWNNNIPVRIDRLYREFLLHCIPPQTNRWCEKTPKNIQYIDKIFDYFGDKVKFINIFRDGRDVITSKHPRNNPDRYWVTPARWINDVKIALKNSHRPNFLNIHYENIVLNFNTQIKIISNFLNENYVPTQDNWIENTAIRKSKHLKKGIQKLHSKSIGRWEDSQHKNIISKFMQNEEAVNLMKKLNYI